FEGVPTDVEPMLNKEFVPNVEPTFELADNGKKFDELLVVVVTPDDVLLCIVVEAGKTLMAAVPN
ncbi:unnamed protein product, partial [Rotaria magnacalcarata]